MSGTKNKGRRQKLFRISQQKNSYTAVAEGAVLAGESAFALAYVAFDIYWKFQQENVIRKIETGLSQKQKDNVDRMDS
ncbi:MAG TPA: hypothetical protein V6C86_08310 [Oculatellaceae cyanobacterium]